MISIISNKNIFSYIVDINLYFYQAFLPNKCLFKNLEIRTFLFESQIVAIT